MRITESQLRRVIKRMLKEQIGGDLPKVGDRYKYQHDWEDYSVTDQATDASGQGYFLQRNWAPGDMIEIVDVRPSEEFAFGRGMARAPDVDDKLMSRKGGAGMPTQPLKGTVSSYRVHFKSLNPPTKPSVDVITRQPRPEPKPGTTYQMELSRFLTMFKPA